MDVSVRERIPAKDDMVDLLKSHIGPVPDGAQKNVVHILVEGGRDNQGCIYAAAARARGMVKIRNEPSYDPFLFWRNFQFVAGSAKQPVE